jgi:hypothetical protein
MTPLLVVLALLHAGDGATSFAAVRAGGVELNPLQTRAPLWQLVEHGAVAGATLVALKRFEHSHPRLARTIAVSAIAVETYAVARNVHTLRVEGSH